MYQLNYAQVILLGNVKSGCDKNQYALPVTKQTKDVLFCAINLLVRLLIERLLVQAHSGTKEEVSFLVISFLSWHIFYM